MRNHKVAACFFRQLPHMEVAVFDALPVVIQIKKHFVFTMLIFQFFKFMKCSRCEFVEFPEE